MTIATMNGVTRTTLFGVLVMVGQPVSAPELAKLCRPLGLSITNVKSHLTRLAAEGAVLRTGLRRAHRYAISPQRQAVVRAISGRLEHLPDEAWDEEWLMVALKSGGGRAERERLRSSLWFEGFRPCAADTYLRPAWPRAWADERAIALGSFASACVIGPLAGTIHLGQVGKLYGLARLDVQARRLAQRIHAVASNVSEPADAFKARITVGGLVAQLVSHVPALPREVWGNLTGLVELHSAYARFEREVDGPSRLYVRAIVSTPSRPATRTEHYRARRAIVRGSSVRRSVTC